MAAFTKRQAAKRFGLNAPTLSRYFTARKTSTLKMLHAGGLHAHAWTKGDMERVRKVLPKIMNGRKLRYKNKRAE